MAELLAPAGNLEKLRYAAKYGADAVYFGVKSFSLRSFARNFSLEDAEEGLRCLHADGKRGYCTLNIYPFAEEYDSLLDVAKNLDDLDVDGIIVADLGVLSMLRKSGIKAPLHISTQANTVSPQTVEVYRQLGASRVNLARELSFERVAALQKQVAGSGMETEVFVHGSVCFSYSGRCAISDWLTGRRANRGECTHPCRWKYDLVEAKRPGEYLPVGEDARGLYIFNSRDLALFAHIERLAALGIASFKIEGRMKSIHYVASVVSFYRRVMDGWTPTEKEALQLLGRVKNRGYTEGFMKGSVESGDYDFANEKSTDGALFVGCVTEESIPEGCVVSVRNKIIGGETLEVLTPNGSVSEVVMPDVFDNRKEELVAKATCREIILPFELPPFSIIRKV
ncbi:MAG: U32 family peptidase [Deltaproteobacteria bacterium]|nr:U32 family peptidase [Deltaproteobacteria bacterium]